MIIFFPIPLWIYIMLMGGYLQLKGNSNVVICIPNFYNFIIIYLCVFIYCSFAISMNV